MTIETTAELGLPWPDNAEAVANGWDAIRDLAEAMETLLAGPWAAFTPTWEFTGGVAGGLADGTAVGRVRKVGRLVAFRAKITLGPSSSAGSGGAAFQIGGLPYAAVDVDALFGLSGMGLGSNGTFGLPVIGDTTTKVGLLHPSSGARASQNSPVSLVNTAWLMVRGIYEAAA